MMNSSNAPQLELDANRVWRAPSALVAELLGTRALRPYSMAVGVPSCAEVRRGTTANTNRCTEAREQLRLWESTRPAAIPQEYKPPPPLQLLERDAWRPAAPLRLLTSPSSGDNGEAARFLPLLHRMQRRQPITILALGSSITGVHGGCTHPVPLLDPPS